MKKFLCYLGLFLFCSSPAYSQQNNTCDKAAEVNTASFGPVNCNGAPDQFCAERNSGGKYFKEEHNVAWLSFVIPADTTLTFDIIPSNSDDDLDFLLFKEEKDGDFCSHLGKIHNHDPIRTNLAKPSDTKGSTGLSNRAEDKIVDKNGISSYSKSFRVKKGEHYYLVVDDKTKPGAFSFNLHLNFKSVPKKPYVQGPSYIDAVPVKVPPIQLPSIILIIKVVDSLGNPVKAELNIAGLKPGETTTIMASEDSFALTPLQGININCNAIGYVFTQTSYIAPDTAIRKTVTISLRAIRKNESIVLKGIEFEEGKAVLLSSSNGPLMNVVAFMRNNSKVKIMIKGYVNDPTGKNPGAAKQLSRERAEAVRDFLRLKGILLNRMDYQGCGNENMLYPNPINEEQRQANRRVEIEIK